MCSFFPFNSKKKVRIVRGSQLTVHKQKTMHAEMLLSLLHDRWKRNITSTDKKGKTIVIMTEEMDLNCE